MFTSHTTHSSLADLFIANQPQHNHRRGRLAIVLPLLILFVLCAGQFHQIQAQTKVLILDSTVTGGASSREAQAAIALGYTVEVVNAAGWAAKTQADFATYRALILGDPTCQTGTSFIAAAEANKAVWGPVINGNVIIIGTDEVFHNGQGGQQLTDGAVKFVVDKAGKTGMMISLSCYYNGTAAMTPVPLLDAFSPGGFSVTHTDCYNNVHITATHPALTGITDSTLSNWSCSTHEAFDKWPLDFQVLAIAKDLGSAYTAPDGTVGTPYILARGVTVLSNIKLTPETAENPVGTSHTVTATVTQDTPVPGTPVVGKLVTFTVISGPNTGATGTGTTNGAGVATFTYTSNGTLGIDVIKATFVDDAGRIQTSNLANKTWVVREDPSPANVSISDQKAGSMLVFPYYTNAGQTDTRISITNVGGATVGNARLHILLLDKSCQQLDYFACVSPNGTLTDKASSFDPLGSGYIIVLVVDPATGLPTPTANIIIGSAYVNDGDFVDSYGAEAFWGPTDILSAVPSEGSKNATVDLRLRVPCEFAIEIQSPKDALQKIITVGLQGDVNKMTVSGSAQNGTGFAFNAQERGGSFQKFLTGGCYSEAVISDTNPRVPTTLAGVIATGNSGHLRFNVNAAVGLILTSNRSKSGWSGIRTLHKTKSTIVTLTVPVFMPTC